MNSIKNKIIFGIIFVAVFSAGVFSIIFLAKKGASKDSTAVLNSQPRLGSLFDPEKELEKFDVNIIGPIGPKDDPTRFNFDVQPEKKSSQPSTIVDTYYFSLVVPANWEIPNATNTLPIIISDKNEQIVNEKAKEIDFKTNLSINSAVLGETSLGDYIEATKARLIQTIPNIEIIKEGQISKDKGNTSYYMEIKSAQQDLEFSTLLFFATGKENSVWAFSFNTLQESLQYYRNIFQQIIDSIAMKSE